MSKNRRLASADSGEDDVLTVDGSVTAHFVKCPVQSNVALVDAQLAPWLPRPALPLAARRRLAGMTKLSIFAS